MPGQTLTNLGTGGSALNAQLGSTTGSDSNDPMFLDCAGTPYIYLPSVNGNHLYTADAAALDITGDIDIRLQVALDDWTPSSTMTLLSKGIWSTSGAYRFEVNTSGNLVFITAPNGITNITATSSVATGLTDGTVKWVRVTRDVDNGAAGNTTVFYTSDDGSSWTQLGTSQVLAGTTSIYNSPDVLEVGSLNLGASTLAAKVYRALVYNGISGTKVLDVDTSVLTTGSATSFNAVTGQSITINRGTTGRKTVAVVSPCYLFGTDDYMTIADNSLLDFAAADSFTVVAVTRRWATTATHAVAAKWNQFAGGYAGYLLYHDSASGLRGLVADTGTITYSTTMTVTAGALHIFGLARDVANDVVKDFSAGAYAANVTDGTTLTSANSDAFTIGRLASGTQPADMELLAVAVFRRVLSAAEVASVTAYYQARLS